MSIRKEILRQQYVGLAIIITFMLVPQGVTSQEIQTTTRITINELGDAIDGDVGAPDVTHNGKTVVFSSSAENLVPGDKNNKRDIFRRNLISGENDLLTNTTNKAGANGNSFMPSISRKSTGGFFFISFESDADNLLTTNQVPDTNGLRDVYAVFPTRDKKKLRISVAPDLSDANGPSSFSSTALQPEPNRALIVYQSEASNLIENDSNGVSDIFLSTITAPGNDDFDPAVNLTTIRIPEGLQANGACSNPRLSGDGRFIVFVSEASNLVPGSSPTTNQIYLYDIEKRETLLVSRAPDSAPGDENSGNPTINYSGSFISYISSAKNLLNDGISTTPDALQIIRYNVATGENTRVNVTADGIAGNGERAKNLTASVDANGRFIAFADRSDNLVSFDSNQRADIFLKDMATGKLIRISEALAGGDSDGSSLFPAFGRTSFNSLNAYIVFASNASNLVLSDTEGNIDLFSSDLLLPALPLTRKTNLEVPPDVVIEGSKASFSFQTFTGIDLNSNISAAKKKKKKQKLKYEIRVDKELDSGKSKRISKKTTKKNSISLKKLKPGTYSSKYRTTVSSGKRTVSKTQFSPPERFSIER